jgi:hypothetical protein
MDEVMLKLSRIADKHIAAWYDNRTSDNEKKMMDAINNLNRYVDKKEKDAVSA